MDDATSRPEAERWLPVPGWEGLYEVSDLGRVRSLPRPEGTRGRRAGKVLKPGNATGGYQVVTLAKSGVHLTRSIHNLVLAAFAGPRPEGPAGEHVRHLDGNPANNRLSNITYGTCAENAQDALRHGRNRNANKTHCDHGHEFTPGNTYTPPGTSYRDCIACQQDRKAGRKTQQTAKPQRSCPVCGTAFTPKHRDSIYCSRRCGEKGRRRKMWPLTPRICPVCATTFTPKCKRDTIYCSTKCRSAGQRQRKADKVA